MAAGREQKLQGEEQDSMLYEECGTLFTLHSPTPTHWMSPQAKNFSMF